ncbi:MAG: DEAD/DEAH box helicase [Synechococcus sp.]
MLPSIVATELRRCVADYLRTTFRPTTPSFETLIESFLDRNETEGTYCKGPYVSIGLPFRQGSVGSGYFKQIPMQFAPHLHQERAFNLLSPPYYQSTLVATGTGSGKTECFLMPILEHCRQNPGPGIKAILIYPMNALATDQSKRIAQLIHQSRSLRNQVTAGLYVGESDEAPSPSMTPDKVITDKNTIRESPPDLLLTNYKMLDYLLIQPETQSLWNHNQPETLRYIVVDEFHTFDGAQGTDLACLLRRLKHRLNTPPQHLACVGTSATLGGESNRKDMLKYASAIFKESFDETALIEEDRLTASEFLEDTLLNVRPLPEPAHIDRLRPETYTTPEEYAIAQAKLWLQDLAPTLPEAQSFLEGQVSLPLSGIPPTLDDNWRIQLGMLLMSLPMVQNLIRQLSQGPTSYEDLWYTLRRRFYIPPNADESYPFLLLDSILALMASARRTIQKPDGSTTVLPWLQLRVQVWFRELKRMVATVKPDPQLQFSDDLLHHQAKHTLPVVHCRDCGATGWAGVKPSENQPTLVPNDLRNFYRAFFSRSPLVTFAFPTGDSPQGPDFLYKLCSNCLRLNRRSAETCESCHHEELISVRVPQVVREEKMRNGDKRNVSSSDCPFCGSSSGLTIVGAQAASLSSAMVGTLFATSFNSDKKLLTFSDSVQDAAHRAGFYDARTYRTTLRTAIHHAIADLPDNLNLAELIHHFPTYWQGRLKTSGDYAATFLPTDMEWLREWDTYVSENKDDLDPNSNLIELVNQRLQWEVTNQFGHRSAVGPSLERSGACSAAFDPSVLAAASKDLHQYLSNEIEALREVDAEVTRQYLLGLLHHLRQRGGILQEATKDYIEQGGNTFILNRPIFMPPIGPRIPTPVYLADGKANADRFERVLLPERRASWSENWTYRCFSSKSLLLKEQIADILSQTLAILGKVGLLESRPCNNGRAWGIPPKAISVAIGGTVLACDRCRHQLTAHNHELDSLQGSNCLTKHCTGRYQPNDNAALAYYRELYRTGQVQRIVAAEHTGLLTRPNRERLEQQFIHGHRRCDPNLLSATSTLEMGIDIGDLSSVLLCSVPPAPANFQQRIGRAGRRDGNALVGTVANGTPHDLFFYSDPKDRMLEGAVDAAGCYLDASAILQRQLTAFCLDNWIQTGIDRIAIPHKLSDVLNAIEKNARERFPHNWLTFIGDRQAELFEKFIALFSEDIEERTQQNLRLFIERGLEDEGSLRWRILNRLEGVRTERTRLSSTINSLRKKIKGRKEQPEALQNEEQLDNLERELAGFRGLMRDLNGKRLLNFLTDEGLLPNYAFPEAGVTLRSIIWRQKQTTERDNGKKYETFTLTYERPGAIAIKELVPSGVFYAEGRRVKIDQVDLRLSEPEDWRICRNCSFSTQAFTSAGKSKTCPRCGDTMWSDRGRVRRMMRLRQVMASNADRKSRFGDDSDDRATSFFQRQLLVDFEPEYRDRTYAIADKDFPFGFEYISRTNFREINFGEPQGVGESFDVAGHKMKVHGFQVCNRCGKVMRSKNPTADDHTISCSMRNKPDRAKAIEALFLFREFESESLRFLMPDEQFWSNRGLHSFLASLQLGLKELFSGKVDHLKTCISEEPQPNSPVRKRFLYLYDSVPGGTGYLNQLVRNPSKLREVFEQSLSRLSSCTCEDGCYNCLFAYRNSFDLDETSRKQGIELLSSILNHWGDLQETSAGLSAIRVDSNLESELERKFLEAIRRYKGTIYDGEPPKLRKEIIEGKAGYYLRIGDSAWTIETQALLGEREGVSIPSRAYFLIRPASGRLESKPIAVFSDGWEYHRDRIHQDLKQRLAIQRSSNYLIWSLSWDDIEEQLEPQTSISRIDCLNCKLFSKFRQNPDSVYRQYNCDLAKLTDAQSFEWLMQYLAAPDEGQWQRWALLRTYAQADPSSLNNPQQKSAWQSELANLIGANCLDCWTVPEKGLFTKLQPDTGLTIWHGIDPNRHKSQDCEGSLVAIALKDTGEPKELKPRWNEALRLLNLYQFLPHTYATFDGQVAALQPSQSASDKGSTDFARQEWEELKELVLEDSLMPVIEQMAADNWPVPEAGYELEGLRNTVIAQSELAWVPAKIAVVVEPLDREAFREEGWEALLVDEFINRFTEIGRQLRGSD